MATELPAPATAIAIPTTTSPAGAASTEAPAYPASSPFSAGSLVAGLLLVAMAVAAAALARRRRRLPRLVEIVETASLGPKRSLVVARLGDEVLVLGSSEGGISLLATRPAGAVLALPVAPLRSAQAASGSDAAVPPGRPERGEAKSTDERAHIPGAAVSLLDRLKKWPHAEAMPSFDAALAESDEDVELRRKLAQGRSGSVR